MNKLNSLLCSIGIAASLLSAGSAFATDITCAGATFPAPIYTKWAKAYHTQTGIGLNYQAIGSGGGIKQIEAQTVDFGASDMPLKPDVLKKNGLMQFPTVMGGVVPVVNINGIKNNELKLSGKVLADIYLGKITRWNDPAIAATNKGVNLPDAAITVVHRSDGSGTTFIFTNYLSKVSPKWESEVGVNTSVSWKVGTGGKGNAGVASYVQRIRNSIGYVEYAYLLQNHMIGVQLQNRAGKFVEPNADSFKAAAAGAKWKTAPGFYEILTNEPGAGSWPIAGATFILMHKKQDKPATAREVLKFFDWAYANGDEMAESLDYIPMPDSVVKLIHGAWHTKITGNSGQRVWK